MNPLEDMLASLHAQTILCVGDVMLDEFIYGEVSRISPEAATPVLTVSRRELRVGGAGNAARNVGSLGAACIFVGVVGEDEEGRTLTAQFLEAENVEAHLVVDAARPTTHKVRYVSEHHSTHLLRADWETKVPLRGETEDAVIERALSLLIRAGVVLLSDYAKGVLTPRVVRTVIEAAQTAGKPIVVDPKGLDYAVYRGATLITPNRKELGDAARRPAGTPAEIEAAALEIARITGSEAVAVTRSEDGMSLVRRDGRAIHIEAHAVRVRDVSGAGDTVAAVLATCLAMGADYEAALHAANAAASIAVGKRGTATVSAGELRARLLPRAAGQKIVVDRRSVGERLQPWREEGLRIGFTNGCFDLLHPGHIKLLTAARAACDRLVVGLNSDASVAGLKGRGRPLQGQQARAEVLGALEAVDLVVIFDEPTPLDLIRDVRPKVLAKGADYRPDQVVGRDLVEADGGELLLVELATGHSTSDLLTRSRG